MPKIKDGRPAKPTAELTQVGKLLRKIRGKLSQAEAAERIGKSSDWWRQRECRVGDCSVAELMEIVHEMRLRIYASGKTIKVLADNERAVFQWNVATP